jgi:hypothetical protein
MRSEAGSEIHVMNRTHLLPELEIGVKLDVTPEPTRFSYHKREQMRGKGTKSIQDRPENGHPKREMPESITRNVFAGSPTRLNDAIRSGRRRNQHQVLIKRNTTAL